MSLNYYSRWVIILRSGIESARVVKTSSRTVQLGAAVPTHSLRIVSSFCLQRRDIYSCCNNLLSAVLLTIENKLSKKDYNWNKYIIRARNTFLFNWQRNKQCAEMGRWYCIKSSKQLIITGGWNITVNYCCKAWQG